MKKIDLTSPYDLYSTIDYVISLILFLVSKPMLPNVHILFLEEEQKAFSFIKTRQSNPATFSECILIAVDSEIVKLNYKSCRV